MTVLRVRLDVSRAPDIKVGSKCWIFDLNARSYDHKGHLVWRKHWREYTVHGETRVSWLAGSRWNPIKIPKKDPHYTRRDGFGRYEVVWNEEELNRMCWDHDHRHNIAQRLSRVDTDTLIEVAKLLGYKDLP